MALFDLTSKIALVTGAAQGIGLAIAQALVTQGARVALVDLNSKQVEVAVKQLRGETLALTADVSKQEQFAAAIDATIQQWGRLDILVNNAGVVSTTPFQEITLAEWERIMTINLTSAFLGCQLAAKSMQAQHFGRIINIASIAGKQGGGLFGTTAYATAKAGLIALSKSAARELAPYHITVNVIAPGPIATPLTAKIPPEAVTRLEQTIPLGRFGQPADIGAGVAYLASDEAAFITGEVLDINGGLLMD